MSYTHGMRVEKTAEYLEWIDALKDRAGRARILVRVERLIQGNPGQYRDLTDGVSELKIDVGPGYRVYYSGSSRNRVGVFWGFQSFGSMQVRTFSRKYSSSRKPYARRWMTRILLLSPSTNPSDTLFSGLQ